ncbi:MAG: D-alanyl-D-alanine carboxypeptidase [Coriobacteriia bacterium]|nr:D-alanyl-D-alanine carboxypeptidase [Coriobacteriia bacterium]
MLRTTAVALVLALSLASASAPAAAVVRPVDRVAGVPVSELEGTDTGRAAPDLEMASGYLGTMEGRELWSRGADRRRPIASTTKIMTAVLVLESGVDAEERVRVSAEAARVGRARYNLRAGDVRSVRQLMEEMLVKSGNDAASALAEHVAGSEEAFVALMNEKARDLGLDDTRYANPHGLDAEGHYSTARDLAALARYAMRDAEFRRIVSMPSCTVSVGGVDRRMENTNVLLGDVEGLVGVKTGMTRSAGWCQVSQAERGEARLLAVVLGTRAEDSRAEQSRLLLEWGFEHYRPRELASAGETMGLVPVSDYLDVAVVARVAEATSTLLFDLDGDLRRALDIVPSVDAPVAEGDRLGTLSVYQGERLVAEVPVAAAAGVPVPTLWERIRVSLVRTWRAWFGPKGPAARSGKPAAAPAVP